MVTPTITTVTDQGRLLIGLGDGSQEQPVKKIAEMNLYKNPVAIFFSILFGWSVDITINNKTYCVSKNDLLCNLQTLQLNEINSFTLLDQVRMMGFNKLIEKNNNINTESCPLLRERVSSEKKIHLFTKLAHQLEAECDINKINKLIRKGADLNQTYTVIDGENVPLFHLKDVQSRIKDIIYYDNKKEITCHTYTPFNKCQDKAGLIVMKNLGKFMHANGAKEELIIEQEYRHIKSKSYLDLIMQRFFIIKLELSSERKVQPSFTIT